MPENESKPSYHSLAPLSGICLYLLLGRDIGSLTSHREASSKVVENLLL